jgi:hypothetical protein
VESASLSRMARPASASNNLRVLAEADSVALIPLAPEEEEPAEQEIQTGSEDSSSNTAGATSEDADAASPEPTQTDPVEPSAATTEQADESPPADDEDPEEADSFELEQAVSGGNEVVISTSGDAFVTSPDGVVKYLDCESEVMTQSHEFKYADFLAALESQGQCAGFCKLPQFYLFSDLNKGPPA